MERQLAAIMFTDIVGYTTMMGEDEERAFQLLHTNRDIQKPLIQRYGGKWLKEIGDGVLASFTNVSQAVLCALEIQQTCCQEQDLRLRIGIHEGEVVFEDNDVFGDGVNIASRLQALAPEGRIWVSESVHKNLLNKRSIRTAFVKEKILKNVKESVRIFEVQDPGLGSPSFDVGVNYQLRRLSSAFWAFLPSLTILFLGYLQFGYHPEQTRTLASIGEEPAAISVLPFHYKGKNEFGQVLSDGLRYDLLTQIDKIDAFSATEFDSTLVPLSPVGSQMILNGAIQLEHNNVRVFAQLSNDLSQRPIWTGAYSANQTTSGILGIERQLILDLAEALDADLLLSDLERLENIPLQRLYLYEHPSLMPQAFNSTVSE